MSDKVKDDLVKSITYFYDLKQNAKYLIYFSQITTQNSINNLNDFNMHVTNGINAWSRLVNDQFLRELIHPQLNDNLSTKLLSFTEFLESLLTCLKTDRFELNTLLETQNSIDLIEFKSINFNFILNPSKSSQNDIKNVLFFSYEKYTKLELEFNKLSSKVDLTQSNSQLNSVTRQKSDGQQTGSDGLKKFNITNNNHVLASRKPGMSIINPLSKRRKTPEGVKFDDDDQND